MMLRIAHPKPKVATSKPVRSLKSDYLVGKQLGKGSFGVVMQCKHAKSGRDCAVKFIAKKKMDSADAIRSEIEVMRAVDHPNIIKLFDVYEDDHEIQMVLELVTGGELFDRIVEREKYSEKVASDTIRSILEGLAYLHSVNIVHRDLKPENLLLFSRETDSDIKIADFGLSSFINPHQKLTAGVGTPDYVAPEVLGTKGYTKAVDMWSVGVILYILLCGYPPFYDENLTKLLEKIAVGKFVFYEEDWGNISASAKDLVARMLTVDPARRITAEQALAHKWVMGEASTAELKGTTEKIRAFNARRKLRSAIRAVMMIKHMDVLATPRTHRDAVSAATARASGAATTR